MLRAKERTPTSYPFVVFTFGLAIESIKEFGDASQVHNCQQRYKKSKNIFKIK
jgi:hypothetical protein